MGKVDLLARDELSKPVG